MINFSKFMLQRIDELGKKTLNRYIKSAEDNSEGLKGIANYHLRQSTKAVHPDSPVDDKDKNIHQSTDAILKRENRVRGIQRAKGKVVKKWFGIHIHETRLDEISKKLAKRYYKAANKDVKGNLTDRIKSLHRAVDRLDRRDFSGQEVGQPVHKAYDRVFKRIEHFNNKVDNRKEGMKKAQRIYLGHKPGAFRKRREPLPRFPIKIKRHNTYKADTHGPWDNKTSRRYYGVPKTLSHTKHVAAKNPAVAIEKIKKATNKRNANVERMAKEKGRTTFLRHKHNVISYTHKPNFKKHETLHHYDNQSMVHYHHPLRADLENLKARKKKVDITLRDKLGSRSSIKKMKRKGYEARPEGKGISTEKLHRYVKKAKEENRFRKKKVEDRVVPWRHHMSPEQERNVTKRARGRIKSIDKSLNKAKRILKNRRNTIVRRNFEDNQ